MVGDSLQRIQYQGVYAQSGYTLTQIRDTYLPYVLALSPKPGACFVMGGTNDCANVGATFSLSYSAGVLQQIVSQLLNAGIAPILTTAPPAHGGGVTTFLANTQKWNTWVKRYAATNGFPLMDVYGAVAGPNGFYKSGFDNGGDGIHPSPIARRAIADQSLADGIADLFPSGGLGGFLTSKSTATSPTC
jgi:lysophospholipase L1-like esterase